MQLSDQFQPLARQFADEVRAEQPEPAARPADDQKFLPNLDTQVPPGLHGDDHLPALTHGHCTVELRARLSFHMLFILLFLLARKIIPQVKKTSSAKGAKGAKGTKGAKDAKDAKGAKGAKGAKSFVPFVSFVVLFFYFSNWCRMGSAAATARARWLMRFFTSGGSWAIVQPNSGR